MIAIILFFLYRVILFSIMGPKAAGYYQIIADWYYVLVLFSVYFIPVIVARLMKVYVEKTEYKNVHNIYRGAVSVFAVIGAGIGLVLFVLAGIISKNLYGVSELAWSFRFFAIQIPICNILGVYRGTLLSRGGSRAVMFSVIIEHVFTFLMALIAVSAYIKNSPQSAVRGFSAAIMLGSLVSLFFCVAVYNTSRSKRLRELKKDASVGYLTEARVIRSLVLDILPLAFCMGGELIGHAISGLMYHILLQVKGFTEVVRVEMYGIYGGVFEILIAIPVVIVYVWCTHYLNHVQTTVGDEDRTAAYIQRLIRVVLTLVLPIFIGYYVLSESLLNCLFSITADLSEKLILFGIPYMIFASLSVATVALLVKMKKYKQTMINMGIALLFQMVVLAILLLITNMNVYALLYSSYVFGVVSATANARTILGAYQVESSWGRTVVMPVFASVIMGILMWILFHLIVVITHIELLSVILSVILSGVIYIVALFFLDMASVADLKMIPGGDVIIRFCKKVHIL